jgi:hypothetical protein
MEVVAEFITSVQSGFVASDSLFHSRFMKK